MASIETLTKILVDVLHDVDHRETLIRQFQEGVWNSPDTASPSRMWNILDELAVDLEYYQPDPSLRGGDTRFYGNDRVEQEVNFALAALRDQGLDVPR